MRSGVVGHNNTHGNRNAPQIPSMEITKPNAELHEPDGVVTTKVGLASLRVRGGGVRAV